MGMGFKFQMGMGMKSLKWEGIGTKNLFPHTSSSGHGHPCLTGCRNSAPKCRLLSCYAAAAADADDDDAMSSIDIRP